MRNGIILGCLLGLMAMALFSTQALGQESAVCPKCKEITQVIKKGGGVSLEKKMVCPDCKGKGTALEPHVCSKCGQEVLLCNLCKKVVAQAMERPTAQVKCPTCKEVVTAIKKMGGVRLEKAMECPSCKEKTERLGVFECQKCGTEMVSCPICRQYGGVLAREEAPVELKCPNCKEVVTVIKKGGVSLERKMTCPDCKKEVKELEAHTCSKCGTDMLLCPLCKKPM